MHFQVIAMLDRNRSISEQIWNCLMILPIVLFSALFVQVETMESPETFIRRSAESMCGASLCNNREAYTLFMDGEFDLGIRLQGRTTQSERRPIREVLAYDPASAQFSYEINWYNYQHSRQHYRQIFMDDGSSLFTDIRNERSGWEGPQLWYGIESRQRRVNPHDLVREILLNPDRLSNVRLSVDGCDMCTAIDYLAHPGELITITFDDRLLPQSASLMIDMPIIGRVEMSWHWSAYGQTSRGYFPEQLTVYLDNAVLKDVSLRLSHEGNADRFAPPPNIATPERPDAWPPHDPDALLPAGETTPDIREIENGMYWLANLRPGFHGFLIETDDHFIAIDAPTGWFEMNQLPPLNWSIGDTNDSLGAKLLEAAELITPGKPIRSLILTHHHSDHIGGMGPLLDAGVEVYAGAPAAQFAELMADARNVAPAITRVSDRVRIATAGRAVDLISLPDGNPKADGYLMVYLPETELLLTTGFIYPLPESVFPLRESTELSEYFVDWLDQSQLPVSTIFNVHGMGRVEPWQLDYFRTGLIGLNAPIEP
jgi:glyoxylase-like metal-dependent hydrolase (beta-lactamase superfamily II)